MNWHKLAIWVLAALFFFMLSGAIASHVLWHQAPLQGYGSASFLFIAGILVLVAAEKQARKRLALTGLIGFVAEVIGVQYGWLFGRYSYTEVLAPHWLGTPIVMICAWFILIGYVNQILLQFQLPARIDVSIGGVWMTVIDLLIDPLAAHPFKYWNWIETGSYYGIPLRNFFGWFVVSALIFSVERLVFGTRKAQNQWNCIVGLGIIVLYTTCAFAYEYFVPGMVGIGLGLTHGVLIGAKPGGASQKSTPEELAN